MALIAILFVSSFFLAAYAEEISMNGNGYIRYDIQNKPFNPNVNRIKLQFRTTHPSGLLVFVTGVKGDSMRLDVIQGTLRITLKNHGITLNEALIGKNLDDNKWHSINILRIRRLLDITLDGISEKTILIPGFFTDLSMNWLLFVGGKGKEAANEHEKKYAQLNNFRGCLRLVTVDNKNPLVELKKGNTNLALLGITSRPCRKDVFKPIHFANPQAMFQLIKIPRSTLDREMSIKLQFRTFDSEGTIVFAEGKRCHFILGVLGKKTFLELEQDEVLPARIEISDDVTNGLWHNIEATITQTAIFLQVNKGSRISAALPKFTSGYQCSIPSRVLIGGGATRKLKRGFVGCFNNVHVNGRNINAFDAKEARLSGTVLAGCRIKDKCFPSPCRNGGSCFQTWHNYGCDCSKTTFYGKHCNIPIYRETCAGYAAMGLKQNSFCLLDSDGTGRLPPFTISCNITQSKEIITVVSHDRAKKMNIIDGTVVIRDSHFHVMNYELGMEQIEALIKKSTACRQFLKFECYNAALLNSPDGPPNAHWQTRTGDVKGYWGGVPDGGVGCKCGLTGSCEKKDRLCNCDSLNNRWAEDSGYITKKELLPVSRLHFTNISHGSAFITLGPLECYGAKEMVEQDERPPNKILSKVCMSDTAKKYMTANDTQLVWVTSVKKSDRVKNIAAENKKDRNIGNTEKTALTDASQTNANSQTSREASNLSPQNTQYPSKSPDSEFAMKESPPSEITINNSLNHLRPENNVPLDSSERLSVERQLSILEIVLIIFAALAISVLLIKFVLMKTIDFFRRRYQIKRLHNNENRNGAESTQPLRGEQSEVVLKKIAPRKGMGAYWV